MSRGPVGMQGVRLEAERAQVAREAAARAAGDDGRPPVFTPFRPVHSAAANGISLRTRRRGYVAPFPWTNTRGD